MKKTLVALAALAATASFAQSSVTLYGTLDASYVSSTTTSGTKAGQWDSAISSSVWGLRGSEDLGGGLKAIFNAESDVVTTTGGNKLEGNAAPTATFTGSSSAVANNATTAAGTVAISGGASDTMFRRAANVGLQGNFGEITLGRRMSLAILNASGMSVMGGNSVSTNNAVVQGTTATFFTKNAVTYLSPVISGFQFGIQTGLVGDGAVLGASAPGNYATTNASLTYSNGPLSAGVATQTVNDSTGGSTGTGALTASNGRISYAVGPLTLGLGSQTVKNSSGVSNSTNMASAVYAVNGNLNVGGTYAINDTSGTYTNLQARYSLSKRTSLYGMASSVNANQSGSGYYTFWNGDRPATTTTGTGVAVGVIHTF